MKLYTVSKLKEVVEGDKIYMKYLKLPIDKNGKYEGVCEVVVNNGEILTTDGGYNFYYTQCESDFANINSEEFMIQIYEV